MLRLTKSFSVYSVVFASMLNLSACGSGGSSGGSNPSSPESEISSSIDSSVSSAELRSSESDASSSIDINSSSLTMSDSSSSSDFSSLSSSSSQSSTLSSEFKNSSSSQIAIEPADEVPDDFTFNAVVDARLNTFVTSNAVTLTGLNEPAVINIKGGFYQIDGGDFTTEAGFIDAGQTVVVRLVSSLEFKTELSATLTIGGVEGIFKVTTESRDITPDQLIIPSVSAVPVNTLVISESLTINGINDAVPIGVTDGEYRINGGEFTNEVGEVFAGNIIEIRHLSAGKEGEESKTEFFVGPEKFEFISVTNYSPTFSTATIAIAPQVIARHALGGRALDSGDIDGDGDIDLISALLDGTVYHHENNGDLGFTQTLIGDFGIGQSSISTFDLDDDGDLDILPGLFNDNKITVFINEGDSGFNDIEIATSSETGRHITAADVDNDGDIDLLAVLISANRIAWYENDSNQNFTERLLDIPGLWSSVAIADMDADKDMDIVLASSSSANIVWYENDGNQSYVRHLVSISNTASDLVIKDIDDDGDVDIITASLLDDEISWYENDGDLKFTHHLINKTNNGPLSVKAVDIDGDGDMDILSLILHDDKIMFFENRGNQDFVETLISNEVNRVFSSVISDLDNDGVFEIVSFDSLGTITSYSQPITSFNGRPGSVSTGILAASDQDGDTLTYNIISGPDAGLFNIDSNTGEIEFVTAPDFNAPSDSNVDNVYYFFVSVSDGFSAANRLVSVKVAP